MANTTKRGNIGTTPFGDYTTLLPAVSTAQIFYPNAMVGWTAAGFIDKMDDAAAKRFAGVIASAQAEVPTGGADGDIKLSVVQPRHIRVTIAAAAAADIGRAVYAVDDQTVTFVPGAFGNLVGFVSQIISSNVVEVECVYTADVGPGAGGTFIASADGAIPIKQGTVIITKGSLAVLTLAAPVTGVDNGKTLTIANTTAFAHTVTNAAPGFNNAGAAGDVATFAAAAGGSFTVIAYNAVWYVENLQGVTLA